MTTDRPKTYTAGAYTSDDPAIVLANIEAACRIGVELAQKGYIPFTPHSMMHGWDTQALAGDDPLTYEAIMRICFGWLSACDVLVMLPGWLHSRGSCRELAWWYVHKPHAPVIFVEEHVIPHIDDLEEWWRQVDERKNPWYRRKYQPLWVGHHRG